MFITVPLLVSESENYISSLQGMQEKVLGMSGHDFLYLFWNTGRTLNLLSFFLPTNVF